MRISAGIFIDKQLVVVYGKRLYLQKKNTEMNTIWIVLPILIVLMFQLGIELEVASFKQVARHPP